MRAVIVALLLAVMSPLAQGLDADVSVSQSAAPFSGWTTGKDVVFTIAVANAGPAAATSVITADTLPSGAAFIWASPGCTHAAGTVTCTLSTLAAGASAQFKVVGRPGFAATGQNSVSVTIGGPVDPNVANNTSSLPIDVGLSTPGALIFRYRLYSDVTKEHHFTTDLNEYNTLGIYVGVWVQEGTAGKVLDNPGSFNGVTAVPYYRLYDTTTQWHHWTTDANEYYTLAQYPWWNAEGVDGYILPSATAGATQLYRLNYPHLGSLHHWTIDANEYATLISVYGWVGEGGAGFVVPVPQVVSTSPLDTAQQVSVLSPVTVTFSEPMDASTLTTGTFTLTGPTGPVAATVSASGNTATLTPSARLMTQASYTATVTTGARNLVGNSLDSNYTFTFTTRIDEPPPIVAGCPTPEATSLLRRLEWGQILDMRRDTGAITSFRVAQSQIGKASVSYTQGQTAATPPSTRIDLTVSRCPGVIETSLDSGCSFTTTFSNFASITAFNREDPNRGGGCLAPNTEQYYVNVRWTFASCPFGVGLCGFSLQWGEGAY